MTRVLVSQPAPPPNPNQAAPSRSELRDNIRELRREVDQAVKDAQSDARVTVDQHGVVVAPRRPGMPGVVVRGGEFDNVIPPQAVDIALGFFFMCAVMVVGWPIARAFGRRIERRGDVATIDPGIASQLQRIEQGMEAMSIEIERISESQRFMAKLQAPSGERTAIPSMERR